MRRVLFNEAASWGLVGRLFLKLDTNVSKAFLCQAHPRGVKVFSTASLLRYLDFVAARQEKLVSHKWVDWTRINVFTAISTAEQPECGQGISLKPARSPRSQDISNSFIIKNRWQAVSLFSAGERINHPLLSWAWIRLWGEAILEYEQSFSDVTPSIYFKTFYLFNLYLTRQVG